MGFLKIQLHSQIDPVEYEATTMIPGAEDLYQKIGQNVFDLGPDDFKEAFVRVEMIDDVSSIGAFFRLSDGTYKYLNKGLEKSLDAFQSLREKFKEVQKEGWSTATFRLSAEGKMTLDVGYDDISDFGLSSERRDAWIKENLGDTPKIDWS